MLNIFNIKFQYEEANWIEFYSFSEYYGGGAPHIIGDNNFEIWLNEHEGFVTQIRDLIDTKVQINDEEILK